MSETQTVLHALLYLEARTRYGYTHDGARWFVLAVVWGGHGLN